MNEKLKGVILTAAGIAGMLSVGTHIASSVWMVALFVIFALFTADGIATIISDCRRWDDKKYKTPRFLDEYMEDRDEE